MTHRASAVLVLLLAGCECADASEPVAPEVRGVPTTPTPTLPPWVSAGVPRASRTDLPEATPGLTIEVQADAMRLDNSALIASWPPPVRERVIAARPDDDGPWPIVEERVVLESGPSPLSSQPLLRAIRRAQRVQRAASGGPAGASFVLRIVGDARWERVLTAWFTAGLAGLDEPRFTLRAPEGDGEVALRAAMATSLPVATDRVLRVAIRADAGIDLAPSGPPGVATECATSIAAREGRPDAVALARCFAVAGEIDRVAFVAAPALPFAWISPVLEVIQAKGAPIDFTVDR